MSRDVATEEAAGPPPTADPPPASAAPAADRPPSFLRANRVSLIALPVAAGLAAGVYFGMPNEHGLSSLWGLLFHLSPFVAAVVVIAYLDVTWAQRLRMHLVLPALCFLVFFTYFISHNFVFHTLDDFDRLYYNQLMMVPFIILALTLCIRLGGGRRSVVVRLAAALLLVQLSGVEDLSFLIIADLRTEESNPIPEVWDWADHMAVRLGHHPSKTEAFVFIGTHLTLAALVLLLPDRLFRSLRDRLLRRRSQTPSPVA